MINADKQRFDWIRFEYVVDRCHHRSSPTEAEKALHCLFDGSCADGEDYADDVFLPRYHMRVYINDQLCWDEWCDFAELGKMLDLSGDFTPFIQFYRRPEDPDIVDVIHSTNDREIIEWRSRFPRLHITGCSDCAEANFCSKLDWSCCINDERAVEHCFRFSAGRFKEEIVNFLRAISAVDHLTAMTLGGPLSVGEMQILASHYQKHWIDFDQSGFQRYLHDRQTIKMLLDGIATHQIGDKLHNHYDLRNRAKKDKS